LTAMIRDDRRQSWAEELQLA